MRGRRRKRDGPFSAGNTLLMHFRVHLNIGYTHDIVLRLDGVLGSISLVALV